jgi:hypothetical protein
MGRKSKLTEKQWHEIERRRLDGETFRALAKEFKVSESTLRERISAQAEKIKDVANQLVSAEKALSSLPVSAQISAQNYAAKLRAISDNLLGAAAHGAATAHRLSALANNEVQKIDDANPLNSSEAIKGVAAMTSLANQSSKIAIDLIAANNKGGVLSDDDADSLESLTDEQLDRLLG